MQTVVEQCQLQPTVGSATGTATARATGTKAVSTSKQPLASRVSTTRAGTAASTAQKLEIRGILGALCFALGWAIHFLL